MYISDMTERIVTSIWWLLVMGFIALSGIGATYAAYWGVGEMAAGRWPGGAGSVALATVLGIGTWLACRHRTDLLCG